MTRVGRQIEVLKRRFIEMGYREEGLLVVPASHERKINAAPKWDAWFEEHVPVVSKAPLARFAVRDCSDGQQVFAFADPDAAFAYKMRWL